VLIGEISVTPIDQLSKRVNRLLWLPKTPSELKMQRF